jgi:NAD(P)-dependent dehydrogenase (short-subunit alcohol dehydrogenase family)
MERGELFRDGRVAIVTGAGHGLGQAFAEALAASGARVVVNDRNDTAEATAEAIRAAGGDAVAAVTSVADPEGVRAIAHTARKAYGRIDILVNNAGIVTQEPLEELTAEHLDRMFGVHLRGAILMTQAVVPAMRAQNHGRVVTVASSAGAFGLRNQVAYSTMKAGQLGMTRALGIELAPVGICVNALLPYAATNPGRTTTDLPDADWEPLAARRWPDHVVPMLLYLASDACDRTGQAYSALSGRYARVFMGLADGWLSPGEQPPSTEALIDALELVDDATSFSIPTCLEDEVTQAARRVIAQQQ